MSHIVGPLTPLALFLGLDDPVVYRRFVTLMQQKCPPEVLDTIAGHLCSSALLPGIIHPCAQNAPMPFHLRISQRYSNLYKDRFWGENAFAFDAGESPVRYLQRGPPINPFRDIRKLHITFGMADLENKFALVEEDVEAEEAGTTDKDIYLNDTHYDDYNPNRGTLLSTSEITSMAFPCSVERSWHRYDINTLSEFLVHAWMSKFFYISHLRLEELRLDFTDCFNPQNGEFLGTDVAQNLEPFRHGYPAVVDIIAPVNMEVTVEMHFRDANGLDAAG
ncbi:MAG: hypothetical protein L6R40_004986 [Gallowayella cf. fulva]|nr:MAG: hypothetical protein L6R40_004986 [Xanthomendoza cf. fulva]